MDSAEGTRFCSAWNFKKGGFVMAIESGPPSSRGVRGSEKVLPPKTLDFVLDQETIELGATGLEPPREQGRTHGEVRGIARLCRRTLKVASRSRSDGGPQAGRPRIISVPGRRCHRSSGEHPQGDHPAAAQSYHQPLHLPGQELRRCWTASGALPAAARFI